MTQAPYPGQRPFNCTAVSVAMFKQIHLHTDVRLYYGIGNQRRDFSTLCHELLVVPSSSQIIVGRLAMSQLVYSTPDCGAIKTHDYQRT